MLNKISRFLNNLLSDGQHSDTLQQPSLAIACAVLLCEVMRADDVFSEQEQQQLRSILTQQFKLSREELETILAQAYQLSENAHDFYLFTSKINQHYSLEQRIEIVNLLWQVAYADGKLASIEEHIIRKIADLLHLRHSEYIATKIAAESARNQVS